ncbi:MAG: hypothetical protein QOE45_3142 [Frankiaceae bacterium]|nr:hypothetical protein [Frankiaceae bacterium]
MNDDFHEVRLIGVPLALIARSGEHHEELMREFQLLAIDPPTSTPGHEVPQRLLDLIATMTTQYGGISDAATAEREAASARGEESTDITITVPASVAEACIRLDRMLDEADEFCRQGERLLTMATPPDAAALRHWYLGEFVAQIGGAPPTSWPAYVEAHPDAFAPA